MIKLDVGCGVNVKESYIGVDAFVTGENITNAPMWDLPYADNSVDEIFSSHALEHAPKNAVAPTLGEWHRVLKPGGTLELHVPDLEWCCRAWLEHKTNDWWLDILFGNQDHSGEFHLTGFTREIMTDYLRQAGWDGEIDFSETWSHRQNTLVFVVTK